MRVIGAATKPNLQFESADGKTVLSFGVTANGSMVVDFNGDWLWLSPKEAKKIKKLIARMEDK